MADAYTYPSFLQQLGLSPEDFAKAQALFQPNAEDRAQARKMGLLNFGLALMGTRKGEEWGGLGRAGLLGTKTYEDQLQDLTKQRGANITQALALQKMAKDALWQKNWSDAMSGAGETQAGPAQPFQTQGGAAGAFNAANGQQPVTNSLPTRVPTQNAQNLYGTLARLNIQGLQQGQKDMSEAIKTMFPAPVPVTEGGATYDRVTGQMTQNPKPPAYHYYDPKTNSFQRVANYDEVVAAEAERARQEAAAKAAGENKYRTMTINGPGNVPETGYVEDLIGDPNGNGGGWKQPTNYTPPPRTTPLAETRDAANPKVFYSGTLSPSELATAQADASLGQRLAGTRTIRGPSASELASVQTAAKGTQELNNNWVTNEYQPARVAADTAKASNFMLDTLEKNPIMKQTGFWTKSAGTVANILAGTPGFDSKWADELATNAQAFERAVYERNWQLLGTQKGVQTEGDARRAMLVFAQLQNTPAANQFIIDFTRAQNDYAKKKDDFYQSKISATDRPENFAQITNDWRKEGVSIWDSPSMKKYQNIGGKQESSGWSSDKEAELQRLRKKYGR